MYKRKQICKNCYSYVKETNGCSTHQRKVKKTETCDKFLDRVKWTEIVKDIVKDFDISKQID